MIDSKHAVFAVSSIVNLLYMLRASKASISLFSVTTVFFSRYVSQSAVFLQHCCIGHPWLAV